MKLLAKSPSILPLILLIGGIGVLTNCAEEIQAPPEKWEDYVALFATSSAAQQQQSSSSEPAASSSSSEATGYSSSATEGSSSSEEASSSSSAIVVIPCSEDNISNYKTVTIGTQEWMAEDLNCETATGSKCYNDDLANCVIYGRLYDWATAMGIGSEYNAQVYNPSAGTKYRGVCPSGWHLPNGDEWQTLINFVDGTSLTSPTTSATAGKKLKANSDLWEINTGTDDHSFAALPGSNYTAGRYDDWWSSSEENQGVACKWRVYYNNDQALWDYSNKPLFNSVRCVKD